jgi:hypothetical protein
MLIPKRVGYKEKTNKKAIAGKIYKKSFLANIRVTPQKRGKEDWFNYSILHPA